MAIYDNVRKYAKQNNTSIAKLERSAGLSAGSISKWNSSQPRILAIRKVAALLNVSIEDLIAKEA